MTTTDKTVSRREFARRAALGAASASLLPLPQIVPPAAAAEPDQEVQLPPDFPKLSPQSQAEAEARYQAILQQYGDRFSAPQKADLKRLCLMAQPPLDRMRAYAIANGTLPALYLKPLVERDKKPAPFSSSAKPAPAAKPDAAKLGATKPGAAKP